MSHTPPRRHSSYGPAFRMYIPNKPAKYGIKIVMLNDVKSKYMLSAIPYLGKKDKNANKVVGLGHQVTVEITKPYHGSNRNVTGDNWFSSIPLAHDLLRSHGLTYLGTMKSNKPEIPIEMKSTANRKPGTSAFLFAK